MKLTNFQIKLAWVVGIGLIICVWIGFPFIFKTLLSFYAFPEDFNEFGAFGDIYGSLNTLISTIALCAVAFSTWLQVNSLKETREANKVQLALSQEIHNAQIKESKYSNFLNIYDSLMSYKLSKYNAIQIFKDERVWHAEEIFKEIALYFLGQDKIFELSLSRDEIGDLYNKTLDKIAGSDKGLHEINSYFLLYKSIFDLIRDAEITNQDKIFFRETISNSMTNHE